MNPHASSPALESWLGCDPFLVGWFPHTCGGDLEERACLDDQAGPFSMSTLGLELAAEALNMDLLAYGQLW